MITKEQALNLKHGDIIHYGDCTKTIGPRGGITIKIENWRVTGKIKTWKTRPNEFSVPIKFGLYESTYLTKYTNQYFHLSNECPLDKE